MGFIGGRYSMKKRLSRHEFRTCDANTLFYNRSRRVPSTYIRILWERVLLTESTVENMFRQLMNAPDRSEETFDKAEELLEDELRPESPLRHRLTTELEELRSLATKP